MASVNKAQRVGSNELLIRFSGQSCLGDSGVIGIVIVAHFGLSEQYLTAVEHVVGKQTGIVPISIGPDDNRKLKETEICQAAEQVDDGNGVVIVTDIFGGTPANLSMLACQPENRKIIYGANLPMLIKLAKSRSLTLEQAVEKALKAGQKYMNCHDGHC
jgi:PTS system mannose-specific IIA component